MMLQRVRAVSPAEELEKVDDDPVFSNLREVVPDSYSPYDQVAAVGHWKAHCLP
jgi:hypothetical protein